MENDKKFRALAIAAICIAIVGVTVAYAALSTKLTITGTATVDTGSAWSVAWLSVTNPLNPDASDTVTRADSSISFGEGNAGIPTISGNSIKFTATFTAPNTSFTFKAKIRNNGTLGAMLQELKEGESYITVSNVSSTSGDIFDFDVTVGGADISTKSGSILAPKNGDTPTDAEVTVTVTLKDMDNEEFLNGNLNGQSATFTLSLPFVQAADGVVTPAF